MFYIILNLNPNKFQTTDWDSPIEYFKFNSLCHIHVII